MSIAVLPPSPGIPVGPVAPRVSAAPSAPAPHAVHWPQLRKWTVDEFQELGNQGWFADERVMLIDGEILAMPISNPPHATSVELAVETLRPVFAAGYHVRNQQPLPLGQSSDPIPDVSVVKGRVRDYLTAHPTTAILVVEVSESTLAYDLNDKASLFAAGGIGDYWVIDLEHRVVIVHRNPQPDATQRFGFHYAQVTTLAPPATISPLHVPNASIAVADLLP